MNVQRASKEQKSYWRSEAKFTAQWKGKVPYGVLQEKLQAFAAGWIAGSNFVKKNRKPPTKEKH